MSVRPFLIGNEWVMGQDEEFVSVNPADGSVAARISGASAADVDRAVEAARAALKNPAWAALRNHERARFLSRFADLADARKEQLARAQMVDNGKTISECRAQAGEAAGIFRYYAAVCETIEAEAPTQRGSSVVITAYEPVGVVAAITPWNSPLTLEAQKIAPILAGGNTLVLKPSEVTSQVALEYAAITKEIGLPAGVFNVVTGASEVGKALVEHPGVDMISFTGGTAAGRAIGEAAGRRLRRVVLELGGKSPNIVFFDADLVRAVQGVAGGIFSGGGQSCIAGSRVFVQKQICDQFLERLLAAAAGYVVGPPEDAASKIGPMATFKHRDHVARYVELAREEGGDVRVGGGIPSSDHLARGAYYQPTVITGLSNRCRVTREEIFGPVAVVIPFEDEDDLIAQANDTEFGLAAGIWTGDFARGWRVGRAIRAGTVWINTYRELSIAAPFGGFKQSGLGREKGRQGMRTYMETKSIYVHTLGRLDCVRP